MSNSWIWLFVAWAIIATFLLLLLFYNTQMSRYEYCQKIGFLNIGEKETMQQHLDSDKNNFEQIEITLAKTIFESDKNQAKLKNIVNSVFLLEKLKRDYNTFAFDLNVCSRFC